MTKKGDKITIPAAEVKNANPRKLTKIELEKKLIDNFVNLQRVLTNLSIKFDSLSDQISKLLQLFEISAKNFAEKTSGLSIEGGREKDKEFLDKIDTLLEQNKTIAKGITLMEERLRERGYVNAFSTAPQVFREEQGKPRFSKF